jgi:small-conductance mechanosensitive channel
MRVTQNFAYRTMFLVAVLLLPVGTNAAERSSSGGQAPSAIEQTPLKSTNRTSGTARAATPDADLRAKARAELASELEKPAEAETGVAKTAGDTIPWSGLLMTGAYILIATLVLLAGIWLLLGARVWLLRRMERMFPITGKAQSALAVDLRRQLQKAARVVTKMIATLGVAALVYAWLVYVLAQFSYSLPWSEQLGTLLLSLLNDLGKGILNALPGVAAIILIILIARWCVKLINVVFNEVQSGRISLSWMERETARTTQTLLIVLVWLMSLVMAYPYIPGSETAAFKGLSVLVGLMVALGSTGLINQLLSGLFVTYSKSVRPEDYVKIGETEGEVVDVGFLATKLKTPWREEITIPHSVLVGTATTNYSRLAGDDGMLVRVSVTIGYDVPWRQVHALLMLGASRTPGIRREPPPRVLQRELSDFYVQYLLLAHLEDAKSRATVLSDLHAQIQDAFNEHGTQIMSPHFESQPQKPVIVPKSAWYAQPTPESAAAEPSDTRQAEAAPANARTVESVPAEAKSVEPIQPGPSESLHSEPLVKPAGSSEAEKNVRKRPILRRNPRAKPPNA